ncbi:hypothetical protein ACGYLO_12480 [Sulfitobacter sp. 1A13353]|uniref:hypothetical protein n=1 Tax=Sulfitobacter sp. 1A13353 TaxID=3368568 RepID=UPI0037450ADD
MNDEALFGVKMTLMMGSEMIPKLKASSKGRSDPLYDQVEAACENFAKLLQDGGLPAVNYEAQRNAEIAQQGKDAEEDPPSGSDFPASDPRMLVDAEWMNVEDYLDEFDCIPLTVHLPLMPRDQFIGAMNVVYEAVRETFSDEIEALDVNGMGMNATLAYKADRPDLLRFLTNAPETAWQAMGNRLYNPSSTTLRQLSGARLMRDMQVLGRENISLHSVKNALRKPSGGFGEAVGREGSDIVMLSHFSAGSLIAMAKFGELEGVLRRVDKAFEGRTSMEHLHSVDYMSEKILDRFSVALNWSAGLKERLDFQKVISHGELSGEGSTQILVRLDGEVVMFLSEESGMVSVPDNSGKPGSQFMQKAGFSISDIDVLFPLISLDLAEVTRVTDFEYQLPIASQSYNTLLKQLAHNLDTMGLIEPASLPVADDLNVEP